MATICGTTSSTSVDPWRWGASLLALLLGLSALSATTAEAQVPGAPVIGVASVINNNNHVSVAFSAPSNSGGGPIMSYTATCGPQSLTGTTSPLVVTGITLGATVNCNVVATNAFGSGIASTNSNNVTLNLQLITFGSAPAIPGNGTGVVTATGGQSGNPIIFTSTTPSVCATTGVNGRTILSMTAGVCIIAANQAGNGTLNAAAQVTQSILMRYSQPTPAMSSGRRDHTGTFIPQENRFLLAGGLSNGLVTGSVQKYYLFDNTWFLGGNLLTARAHHTATLFDDGGVLVAGGYDGNAIASAETYNLNSNAWTATGAMTTARYHHTATLLLNGKVLVVGGASVDLASATATAEIYDPATRLWSAAGSMSQSRYSHTATLLANGDVVVIGGSGGTAIGGRASIERYVAAMNTWVSVAALATPRYRHTATLLSTGRILIAGGIGSSAALASTELYDLATNVVTAGTPMSVARDQFTATALATQTPAFSENAYVLVAGPDSYELYDAAADRWTPAGATQVQRIGHSASFYALEGGTVLIAGGDTSGSAEVFVLPRLPGIPFIGTAVGLIYDGSTPGASVSFTPPTSPTANPVTRYTATSSPGGISGSCTAPCNSIDIRGLTFGTTYTFTVRATSAWGNGLNSAVSNSATPLPLQSQTITFGTAPTIPVGGTGSVTATGGASGNPVTFTSITPGVCSVSGVSGSTVTGITRGFCTIVANQAGNAIYNDAPHAFQRIDVGTQSIAVTAPTVYAGYPRTLVGIGGGSGNPVVFTSATPTICTATGTNGTTLTRITDGTCLITANQAAGGAYIAAAPLTVMSLTPQREALAASERHSLAIRGDGTLWSAGSSDPFFRQVGSATNYTSVVAATCDGNICGGDGAERSAAIRTDGTLWRWEGNGTTPTQDTTANNFIALSACSGCLIGITADGRAWTWDESRNINPTPIPGRWKAVAANNNEYLMIPLDGSTPNDGSIWKLNRYSPIGTAPVFFDGGSTTRFRQLATGPYDNATNFAMATFPNQSEQTYVWGGNACGNYGSGSYVVFAVPVPLGVGWAEFKLGGYSTVARRLDGSLWSWGCNAFGNIGQGILDETPTPIQIGSATNWDAIAASSYHMLARLSDGSLWAAGNNGYGQLGNGTNSNSNVLVQSLQAPAIGVASAGAGSATVSFTPLGDTYNPVTGYRAISTPGGLIGSCVAPCSSIVVNGLSGGSSYTFTVAATNSAGNGRDSAASNSVVISTLMPQTIVFEPPTVYAGHPRTLNASGGGSGNPIVFGSTTPAVCTTTGSNGTILTRIADGACMITASQAAGNGYAAGAVMVTSYTPQREALATTLYHTLAIRGDGSVWSAGFNGGGQLGNGTTTQQLIFGPVASLSNVMTVAAGQHHSAAIRADGTLWRWGFGSNTTPTQESTTNNWIALAACDECLIGLTADGSAWVWDSVVLAPRLVANHRWIAIAANTTEFVMIRHDGTLWKLTRNGSVPEQIGSSNAWRQVATKERADGSSDPTKFARRADGTLWVWGSNLCGQYGDTTNNVYTSPTQVGTSADWAEVKVGHDSTIARRSDGSLWSWGCNALGQIGQGGLTNTPIPVQVGTATNWDAISMSQTDFVARRNDGTLWGSGENSAGSRGTGTDLISTIPEQSLQAPLIGVASTGVGSATVSFTPLPPTYNPVTGYRAINTPGGLIGSCVAPCSSINVSGLSAGVSYTFTIAATNSAGNGQDSAGSNSVTPTAAPTTFTVTPSAGANGSISPSVAQTVISGATSVFTVTPNSGYSASVGGTCGGSINGTNYTTAAVTANCTVVASFTSNVALIAVQSRKTHGAAGTFDLPINTSLLISDAVDVEPRAIGAGHNIVFQFDQTVTSIGLVSAVDASANTIGTASAVINMANTNEVIVTLTGVLDTNRVTITVNGVNGTLSRAVSIGFLVGDVNNSRAVNNGDITAVKTRNGQAVDSTTFRYDVNASGSINSGDITATKTRVGLGV
jgi:alpha-tubulin suppressor-like RCC1 family protein